MDPQLQAIRQAARDRFLAQRVTGVAQPAVAAATSSGEAAAASASRSAAAAGLPATVARLPAELLDAPISALLADGPPLEPPAKRMRMEDPSALRVPPERTAEIRRLLALPPPAAVRVLSWNIDGLDEVGGPKGLMLRTLAVALEVARQRPVAVLLQEVVPPALELLSAKQVLGDAYEVLVPEDPPMPYYVAILVDRKRAKQLGRPQTQDFPGTKMGRQLFAVALGLEGCPPLLLATAHLESTKDEGPERKRQLAQGLRFLRAAVGHVPAGAPPGSERVAAALLGGDLNLRDEEVKAVFRQLGDEAKGIADAWQFTGSSEASRWTWDTAANSNLGAMYTCRTRFDRIFFLSSGVPDVAGAGTRQRPAAKGKAAAKSRGGSGLAGAEASSSQAAAAGWRPTSFSLVGKEKVPSLGRFPSDHWGMMTSWSPGSAAASPTAAAAPVAPEQPPSKPLAAGGGAEDAGGAAAQASQPAAGGGKLASLKPGRVLIDLDD